MGLGAITAHGSLGRDLEMRARCAQVVARHGLQRVDINDHADIIDADLMIAEDLWEMRRYTRPLNPWFLR